MDRLGRILTPCSIPESELQCHNALLGRGAGAHVGYAAFVA